jgi:hypothetical protein
VVAWQQFAACGAAVLADDPARELPPERLKRPKARLIAQRY